MNSRNILVYRSMLVREAEFMYFIFSLLVTGGKGNIVGSSKIWG